MCGKNTSATWEATWEIKTVNTASGYLASSHEIIKLQTSDELLINRSCPKVAYRLFSPRSTQYCLKKQHHVPVNRFPNVWDKAPCSWWVVVPRSTYTEQFLLFTHKIPVASIRSVQCEVELNRGNLEVDWLTKQSSQVTEQRAKTGNAFVLNFCTFSWFLSIYYWLFLIIEVNLLRLWWM